MMAKKNCVCVWGGGGRGQEGVCSPLAVPLAPPQTPPSPARPATPLAAHALVGPCAGGASAQSPARVAYPQLPTRRSRR